MGINDEVRDNSLDGEGKVFLSESHAASSFLAMEAGKFVTDLGDSDTSDLNFDSFLIL